MGDTSAKDYAAQIATQLHPYIEFLRDRWKEFCELVEKNAKRLASCQEEYLGPLQRMKEKYPSSFFSDREQYKQAVAAGDTKKSRQFEKIAERNKAEYERIVSRMDEEEKRRQDQGWVVWGVSFDTQYLKLPLWVPGKCFYAPPEVVNPVLWVLDEGGNPRGPRPEETLLCRYAILCRTHDDNVSEGEQRIYCRGTYTGKYFACDEFYCRKPPLLEHHWSAERLQRAFDNVKPALDEWREQQKKSSADAPGGGATTEPPGEARQGGRITKDEANVRARVLIKENPSISVRQLKEKIPCSIGLVSQLPAWIALQEYKKETFGGKRPKIVPLTKDLEYILGTDDEKRDQLIAEQEQEDRQDARGAKLYLNPQRKPKRSSR